MPSISYVAAGHKKTDPKAELINEDEIQSSFTVIRFCVFSSLLPCSHFSATQLCVLEFYPTSRKVEEVSCVHLSDAFHEDVLEHFLLRLLKRWT